MSHICIYLTNYQISILPLIWEDANYYENVLAKYNMLGVEAKKKRQVSQLAYRQKKLMRQEGGTTRI